MATAKLASGIELCYEIQGEGPDTLVMVMGLNAQLVHWPRGMIAALVATGLRVVTFDNRDIGLSSKLLDRGVPNVRRALLRSLVGLQPQAPYTLKDMAGDLCGLLDHLKLDQAHVIGVSMGGMIAQTFAIEHPERVASLISMMSSPGGHRYVPTPRALKALLQPTGRSKEELVARFINVMQVVGSPGFPFDDELAREVSGEAWERDHRPGGFQRQFVAILASGSRRRALQRLKVPTLVIHGDSDPLVPPRGGRDTAALVPGARLEVIKGMGHSLPRQLWARYAELISGHVRTNSIAGSAP